MAWEAHYLLASTAHHLAFPRSQVAECAHGPGDYGGGAGGSLCAGGSHLQSHLQVLKPLSRSSSGIAADLESC